MRKNMTARTSLARAKHNPLFPGVFLFFLFLFASLSLLAQNVRITGRVVDEGGKGLAGVSVVDEETRNGTATDEAGNYALAVRSTSTRLTFTYVGYTRQTIAINGNTTLNITLRPGNNSGLDEVVVIGYGTARRRDLAGAINTVTSKDFGNNSATSAGQLLQGKAAGVQVVNNSGLPGSGTNIIIRGVGSLTTVSPLYVVDGIQSDAGIFNALNPQDIESITLLKDAASTAIYGANGANGVVLVTTKKGRPGGLRISFNSQYGTAWRPKKLDVLNAAQYLDLAKDFSASTGSVLPDKFNSPDIAVTRTDWQDAIFRNAPVSNNTLSLSGGSENVLYTLSAGYIDQKAIVQNYRYTATNVRFSLDERLGIFHFGQSVNARFTRSTGNAANIQDALYMQPYFAIYDPTRLGGFTAATNVKDLSDAGNPLVNIYNRNTVNKSFVLNPQVFGEVNLLKSLRFRSQLSLNYGGSSFSEYQKPFINGNDLLTGRSSSLAHGAYNGYLIENYGTWNGSFANGKHKLELTAGNSYIDKGRNSYMAAKGTGIANDAVQSISVALSNTVTSANEGYGNTNVLISYFGRLQYGFADKYILNASLRRDGSSNFSPSNRFGNFPGIGLAWNASNEAFLKNSRTISDLKVRANWGRVGNSNIGAFRTTTNTYSGSPTGNVVYSFGAAEGFFAGTTINAIPNAAIKWEETTQTDAGFDLGLLRNTIQFTFDWYKRSNKDLLLDVPIPNSTGAGGVSGGPTLPANAATAENTGVEAALTYRHPSRSGLNYSITVNGSYNKNTVISLGSQFTAPLRSGAYNQNAAITYTSATYTIGSFYGRRVDHVAIDQNDVQAYNKKAQHASGGTVSEYQSNLKPGDFIFKDLNGNGYIDDGDVEVLGNGQPKFVYGASGNFSFKDFDFNFSAAGYAGHKLYHEQYFTFYGTSSLHNVGADYVNRWRKPGDIAKYPRAGQNQSANLQPSDFYVEDGGFMRVRLLTLGYTVPKSVLSSFSGRIFSSIRVYVTGENLITITKYKGFDPEISSPNAGTSGLDFILTRGIDRGQLPVPKSVLFGIQLGL
jgi:TonB-linked SusC/RagA family outer membrane protein